MNFKSLVFSVVSLLAVASVQSDALAQSNSKSAPTAETVKALIVANKNGGPALTQSLIAAIKANPKLVDAIIDSSKDASPQLLAAISAAISQAVVEIAQTNPAIAAEIKKTVEAKAPEALRQQVALNLAGSTTATASTGGAGPLGDVGVPLTPSTPSSSRSPV
jgi:predicted LPLAT superfamily acyltransferase